MSFTPTVGMLAKLTWTLGAGQANYACPGVNWKLEIDGKVVDKSNFRDGRYKIGTLADATLSLTLVWDSADWATKSTVANLRHGVAGNVQCYIDATRYFVVPVVVQTLAPENAGVEDTVMMDVSFGLSGNLTYPSDT